MLWNFETLRGYTLHATDGDIGLIKDILFDDGNWSVRYLVVDTGKWLLGRDVLIVPSVLHAPEGEHKRIPVDLTMNKIRHSPDVNTARPVARHQEAALHGYYGWPPYWGGPGVVSGAVSTGFAGGSPGFATEPDVERQARKDQDLSEKGANSRLRSTREVEGYHIHATDGTIGRVEDIVIDCPDRGQDWNIRWLVVDISRWLLPGKKVTLSPDWVQHIDWAEREIRVDLTREQVREAPEYDPMAAFERGYEDRLYGYYGRMPYW